MVNKNLVALAAFIIAVGIALFASSYRNVNNNERVRFFLDINQKKDNIITVDLAKQSIFKYYIQPNILSFYGRGKVHANGENLVAKFSGVDTYASQGSKKSLWTELADNEKLQIDNKGRLMVNWEVRLPWASTRRYKVAEARCELLQNNTVISVTKFYIVNSHYK